jgi:hypothetical protein
MSIYTFKTIATMTEIEEYEDGWNHLALIQPYCEPMISGSWVIPYLKHCINEGDSWICFIALDENLQLAGIWPLIIKNYKCLGLTRVKLCSIYDDHTRFSDSLTKPGEGSVINEMFINEILRAYTHLYSIELIGLNQKSELRNTIHGLKDVFTYEETDAPAAFIDTKKPFNQYHNKLSKKFKGNLRNAMNRINKNGGYEVYCFNGSDVDEMRINSFMDIEGSGWKNKIGTSINSIYNIKQFYLAMIDGMKNNGWMELYFLKHNNIYITSLIAVRMGNTLSILKIGYLEEYGKYSPSHLLLQNIIEKAFNENEIDEINFVSNAEWIYTWETTEHNYYNQWIYPKKTLSYLFGYVNNKIKGYLLKKKIIKKILQIVKKRRVRSAQ